MKSISNRMSRRTFLKRSAAATAATAAFPCIVPSSALGADGAVAPSERITLAAIGVGGMGTGNLNAFLGDPRVQVVAVCDVEKAHRDRAREIAGLDEASSYNDFRDVIARDDIDVVSIATPDHWHAAITIAAARAGKDIYCEKPLSLTVEEGRAMVNAVRGYQRVLQTGTWRRSRPACRYACELVQNGRIGEVKEIRAAVPEGFQIRGGDQLSDPTPQPVPEGFDYDMWLGPAPYAPYTPGRCHFNFRWLLDYGEGYISDWGAHYLDVAQWGNGTDRTGPRYINGTAEFPKTGLYDAPIKHRIEFEFPNAARIVSYTTMKSEEWGIWFEGTEGRIYVESAKVVAEPAYVAQSEIKPDEIHLYNSDNHHTNFIDCVLNRGETAAPVEIAHCSAAICHVGTIGAILGRPLEWDPDEERFVNDDEANSMLGRARRAPWNLDA